jgi:hypothetical protein
MWSSVLVGCLCVSFSLAQTLGGGGGVGGYVPVNPLNEQVVAAAQFAVDKLNTLKLASCYNKYTYTRVLKASQQVVNGINFQLEIEVSTAKAGSGCTTRASDGPYIIRGVVVYQSFSGDRSITTPATDSDIQFFKAKQSVGKPCSEARGSTGCLSSAHCLTSGKCAARIRTGSSCDLSTGRDPCLIGSYCMSGKCTLVQ